jgi:hypothetical protein
MSIKAEITQVPIGSLSMEGLMSENGEFGVAIPQYADLFETSRNTASRDIKRLLDKGSKTSITLEKWKTPFNQAGVNVIRLEQWSSLVFELALSGNQKAIELSRVMQDLSWHQLFADAFDIKFEKEDRQQRLITRMRTKHDFRPLTDMLKAFGFVEGKDFARFIWAFQTKLGIESGTRDEISIDKLVALQGAQVRLTTLMECGIHPWTALSKL